MSARHSSNPSARETRTSDKRRNARTNNQTEDEVLDLFQPKIPKPANARRVTLIDMATSDESRHRQRCEALIKGRASIKSKRGPKARVLSDERMASAQARKAEYARQRYAADIERLREIARERMRARRAKQRGL